MDKITRAILIGRLRAALLPIELDELAIEIPEINDLRHKLELEHKRIISDEDYPPNAPKEEK